MHNDDRAFRQTSRHFYLSAGLLAELDERALRPAIGRDKHRPSSGLTFPPQDIVQ